eukprot:CAMPEP_0119317752 /NCGR_PEP_ID=MMETSP1333-20130426/44195_1 /TAXON_ID=418940 /ORGANISM="Scyphosphaera apsteinii, Strain RCC1455" /LENGTH=275 /DNA_ID=CAMNT_0007323781 /DNA_START=18 /DNA_END=842 /DNA_ORIENTATION=+
MKIVLNSVASKLSTELSVPLRINEASLITWDWSVTNAPDAQFAVQFTPSKYCQPYHGKRCVVGTKVGSDVPIVLEQTSSTDQVQQSKICLLGPLHSQSHSGKAEIEAHGDAELLWTGGPGDGLFTSAADVKYTVTIQEMAELRAEQEAHERIEAQKESVRQAKIAELTGKAVSQQNVLLSLRAQSETYMATLLATTTMLEERQAQVEQQQARVAEETARLEKLQGVVAELEAELAQHERLHGELMTQSEVARSWNQLYLDEAEKFRSGEWVFKGW